MNDEITSVTNYIESVESLLTTTAIFRGQTCFKPLLPKIARRDCTIDTTEKEKIILEEFRRRTAQDSNLTNLDDWDSLVYAQHFGMATRLLDWTTNPLIALWFACSDLKEDSHGYVYLLFVEHDMLLDKKKDKSPFAIKHTRVFKPNINNQRVAAQDGWFTVHRYATKDSKFVDLRNNKEIKGKVLMKSVAGNLKPDILKSLDKLGVNHESVYPGLEGTCQYINWVNQLCT